jgi:hypothetical protein
MIKIISSWTLVALVTFVTIFTFNYVTTPRMKHIKVEGLQFNIDRESRTITSIETYKGGFRFNRVSCKIVFDEKCQSC